jgi:Fur family zinc uptake transcriptional regulator
VLCAKRGARLTPQRRYVLAIMRRSDRRLGADQELERLGTKAARPTLYRSFDVLLDLGLIQDR